MSNFFPPTLDTLVDCLAALPGVGRKSAQRLAFHLLSVPEAEARRLAAPVEEGAGVGDPVADVQRPDALGAAQLVAGDGDVVRAQGGGGKGNL